MELSVRRFTPGSVGIMEAFPFAASTSMERGRTSTGTWASILNSFIPTGQRSLFPARILHISTRRRLLELLHKRVSAVSRLLGGMKNTNPPNVKRQSTAEFHYSDGQSDSQILNSVWKPDSSARTVLRPEATSIVCSKILLPTASTDSSPSRMLPALMSISPL